MGIFDTLGNFKSGFVGLATYAWVLYIFVPIALLIFGGYMWKITRDKKKQWTHTLRMKRVLADNSISREVIIKMKRFPLVKNASIFELENPLLGSYLIPELDSYTGLNEFSIIVDKNNRIYINTGEKFNPDSSSIIVSAKHAGIDLAFEDLKGDWTNQYKTNKRVEWSQIAKFALWGILIIALMVVSIKFIGQWGENNARDAEKALAEAEYARQMKETAEITESTMNAMVLVLDLLKDNYKTNNIQGIVREKLNVTV